MMRAFLVAAYASILARITLAKVFLGLTSTSHPTRLTYAVVVIDQLDAFLRAIGRTGIGQAFVNVSFATRTDKARKTLTIVTTNFVDTGSPVMTGPFKTFIDVDFAEQAHRSMRTGAFEIVHQIVADAIVLTRIAIAVVDVEVTILALVAFGAEAFVVANEIFARGSVLAGIA